MHSIGMRAVKRQCAACVSVSVSVSVVVCVACVWCEEECPGDAHLRACA